MRRAYPPFHIYFLRIPNSVRDKANGERESTDDFPC